MIEHIGLPYKVYMRASCFFLWSAAISFGFTTLFLLFGLIHFFAYPNPLPADKNFYMEAIEVNAIVKDNGENWDLILENETVFTYPKKSLNPTFKDGKTVKIATDLSMTSLITDLNYTLDGITVYNPAGKEVGTAEEIGYDKFISNEEYKERLSELEMLEEHISYNAPVKFIRYFVFSIISGFMCLILGVLFERKEGIPFDFYF